MSPGSSSWAMVGRLTAEFGSANAHGEVKSGHGQFSCFPHGYLSGYARV